MICWYLIIVIAANQYIVLNCVVIGSKYRSSVQHVDLYWQRGTVKLWYIFFAFIPTVEKWRLKLLMCRVRFKSLVSSVCLLIWEDEEERLLVCNHLSLAASSVCVCVCVPKLQRGVELLCASFRYVMRNHIKIHFSAGRAWQAWHAFCFVFTIRLLLLSCPSPSILAHHLSSTPPSPPPHAWQGKVLCLSLCECIHQFVHERNVCGYLWSYTCFCTAGSRHTSANSCKVKGHFVTALLQLLSSI